MVERKGSICLLPRKLGVGGGASFQERFIEKVTERGIRVHHDPNSPGCTCILVNGGTRHLGSMWRAKQRGIRIVQRLDGFNWIHRRRKTGVYHYLRSETNNGLLALIRRSLSDAIIYQSLYVQERWDQVFGKLNSQSQVIYNGVDLNRFSPGEKIELPKDHIRLLVVEGGFRGGHEIGLENAIMLGEAIQQLRDQPVELVIAARVDDHVRLSMGNRSKLWITWRGVIPREEIVALDRSAHMLFSAEINPPCPNSVIEALACGLPVIAYATGSLPELVTNDAGKLVPYGRLYEKLGTPDVNALAIAACEVLDNQTRYRRGARNRAVEKFDITHIIDDYLQVLYE